MSTWTLTDPTGSLDPLVLTRPSGLSVYEYNLGVAIPREVVEDRPARDGSIDLTGLHSGRIITLDVQLYGSIADRQILAGKLRAWAAPAQRIALLWNENGIGNLQASARLGVFDSTVRRQLQVQSARLPFVVASGILESQTLQSATIYPGTLVEAGRTYDLTFDRTYPAQSPPGAATLFNAGTAPNDLVVNIYGACTNPTFRINGGEGFVAFTANGGLTIAAGDRVVIDSSANTCMLNGTVSVLDKVAPSTLVWPRVRKGANDARFEATSTTAPSNAVVTWRDGYY